MWEHIRKNCSDWVSWTLQIFWRRNKNQCNDILVSTHSRVWKSFCLRHSGEHAGIQINIHALGSKRCQEHMLCMSMTWLKIDTNLDCTKILEYSELLDTWFDADNDMFLDTFLMVVRTFVFWRKETHFELWDICWLVMFRVLCRIWSRCRPRESNYLQEEAQLGSCTADCLWLHQFV